MQPPPTSALPLVLVLITYIYVKLSPQQAPVATATLQNSPSQQMRHPPEGTWSPTLCLWPPPLIRCFSRAWGGQMTWRTSHSLTRLASCTDTKKGFWWRGQYVILMRLATSSVLFFLHEINYYYFICHPTTIGESSPKLPKLHGLTLSLTVSLNSLGMQSLEPQAKVRRRFVCRLESEPITRKIRASTSSLFIPLFFSRAAASHHFC